VDEHAICVDMHTISKFAMNEFMFVCLFVWLFVCLEIVRCGTS
jgi:hypothetical protein